MSVDDLEVEWVEDAECALDITYDGETHRTVDGWDRWENVIEHSDVRRRGVRETDYEAHAQILRDAYVQLGLPRGFAQKLTPEALVKLGKIGDEMLQERE